MIHGQRGLNWPLRSDYCNCTHVAQASFVADWLTALVFWPPCCAYWPVVPGANWASGGVVVVVVVEVAVVVDYRWKVDNTGEWASDTVVVWVGIEEPATCC